MALRPAPASAIGWPRTDRASHIESVSGGWFRVSSAARRMGAANAIYRTKLIRMMAQRYGDATKLGKTKHLFPSFFSLWLFLFIYFFLSFPFSIFSFFSYRLLRLKKKKRGEKKMVREPIIQQRIKQGKYEKESQSWSNYLQVHLISCCCCCCWGHWIRSPP